MRCFNRHNNGIYLLTCLEPDGHKGLHKDDGGETWNDSEGWYDQHGDKKRKVSECKMPAEVERPVEPEPEPDIEEKADLSATACFYCRQGQHDRCAFPPEFCPCKRAGHEVKV